MAIALHGVGGHGDDARFCRDPWQRPDAACGLVAVHLRHLAIHQNGVERGGCGGGNGGGAGFDDGGMDAAFGELKGDDALVHGMVLCHEDGQRGGAGDGGLRGGEMARGDGLGEGGEELVAADGFEKDGDGALVAEGLCQRKSRGAGGDDEFGGEVKG